MEQSSGKPIVFRAERADKEHLARLVASTGIDSSKIMRIALRLLTRETLLKAVDDGVLAETPQQEPAA